MRTVKGAKLSGNKSELVTRVKGYIEHPEILESIQKAPKSTVTTALDIDSIDETSLCWNSDTNYLTTISDIEIRDTYIKKTFFNIFMENSPVNPLPPLLFWPEKSLASSYKTIAIATKIISHLSNIEKGEGG